MEEHGLSRRALGALAVGGAAAGLASCGAPGGEVQPKARAFPQGFVWGAACAAFQTEGAPTADGRGPSVWDSFQERPGAIEDGSTAKVATDSYRRWAEDADLAAGAGVKAYRFSLSWPRVLPGGTGAVAQAGLDHYARLVDGLLERGVTPYATLFHWDLPQALQDRGGWAWRDAAKAFGDYAALVGEKLGDRIKSIIVLNEPAVHAVFGHVTGEHAPGLKDAGLLGPVVHHMNLGQGLAIQALRAARSDLSIGTTLALQPCRPAGGGLAFWNRLAADGLDDLWNKAWLDPLLKGEYPDAMGEFLGGRVQAGDLATIRQKLDFMGVNYYAPAYMRLAPLSPGRIAPADPPRGVERDAFGRHVDPSGLLEVLTRLRTEYGNPPVFVTENGCSDPFGDGPAIQADTFRIAFLRRHLQAVKAAMEAGSPVRGFFAWTLIDNWEWTHGYRSKFGLVAHDRATGVRTPKASYAWYAALARSGVLPSAP